MQLCLLMFDTAAVDPMTLADMLSDADITSIEGSRVRLASSSSTSTGSKCNLMQGELDLVSAYNEKYLLGYAFCGGLQDILSD